MVSQTEATTSRIQKEPARHHSNTEEEVSSHGNAQGDKALAVCKSLVVGGVAGRVSRSTVAPLERLKILLQVQNPLKIKYNGTVQGLKYIWRETGQEDAELTPLLRLGVGACVEIIAMSARYPMDMVRGSLTVQTKDSPMHYRGMFHAGSTIMKEEGPLAIYKGWFPYVIGMIPYTMAYPLDLVLRRMQMVGWKNASYVIITDGHIKAPVQYTGIIDALGKTTCNEGFGALYKGLIPNSIKVLPSIAWAFVTYKVMKDLLGVEFQISN
ncbi:hypothetical protein GOP47_0004320 [Adiantum capillus-veneris]|uniref:Mitochondrial carrier protein n=1 Tax=Adiantum capillus-veneris TaxID=13818 RepID=A0A9D4V7W7_ADICA|nr:hypothetical protein GOP47_0004320 [Adiantum capillus-veneris]